MKIETIHILLTIKSVSSTSFAYVSPAEGKINCRHILVCDAPSFIMILLSIWILWNCSLRLLSLILVEGAKLTPVDGVLFTAKANSSCVNLQVSLLSEAERPRTLSGTGAVCRSELWHGESKSAGDHKVNWYLNFMENLRMTGKSLLWLWLCQCFWCSSCPEQHSN